MYTAETEARIDELTRKALSNEMSLEEMREAVKILRGDRMAAANAAAKSRSKAKVAVVSGDDLLDELGAE